MEKLKVEKSTIVRLVIQIVALLNTVLTMQGKPILNLSDETITQGVNIAITIFAWAWGYWKNNSFTNEALHADAYLKKLKGN
jgi:SPP1 family holin